MKRLALLCCIALLVAACSKTPGTIENHGKIILQNELGQDNIVDYTCRNCSKYIETDSIAFNQIMTNIQQDLSMYVHEPFPFNYTHMDLNIELLDTLYHYETGEAYPNIYEVSGTIKYEFTNANSKIEKQEYLYKALYQKKTGEWNLMPELQYNVRLEPITMDRSGHYSRTLTLTNGMKSLEFEPSPDGSFCIRTTAGCVEPGTVFKVIFEDGSEIIKLSDNEANCDGLSCYSKLNGTERNFLTHKKVKKIYFHSSRQSIMFPMPNNQRDFFINLFNLKAE